MTVIACRCTCAVDVPAQSPSPPGGGFYFGGRENPSISGALARRDPHAPYRTEFPTWLTSEQSLLLQLHSLPSLVQRWRKVVEVVAERAEQEAALVVPPQGLPAVAAALQAL
jgi:hypothetical protein